MSTSAAAAAPASAPESVDAYVHLALTLAHRAGATLMRSWRLHPNDRPRFSTKSGSADVVTETDRECERIIFTGVRGAYPHHKLLGEESHEAEGSYPVAPLGSSDISWIVDPIDGTNNFVHQLANVAVSIAVLRGREVLVGVVHRPVANETYYAVRGAGAWRVRVDTEAGEAGVAVPVAVAGAPLLSGAVRLRVSDTTALSTACVATEMGYSRSAAHVELMLAKCGALLAAQTQSLRMSGSCCCNMADVAAGRLDAYFEGISTSTGPKPWDVAAASLIVTESGGMCMDPSGAPFSLWNGRVLVAANPTLAQAIVDALNRSTDEWSAKYPQLAHTVAYLPHAGMQRSASPGAKL